MTCPALTSSGRFKAPASSLAGRPGDLQADIEIWHRVGQRPHGNEIHADLATARTFSSVMPPDA